MAEDRANNPSRRPKFDDVDASYWYSKAGVTPDDISESAAKHNMEKPNE